MVPSRLADLIRKARRLAAERDRLIDGLAQDWARALRGQGLSAADLDELWAGLMEDAVRRGRELGEEKGSAQAWRHEAKEVIARVRQRVEAELGER
ncbi:MAG: hypothetical protein A2W08_00800 [Candidatus Rokubacteria bacterium RBG_16_73_20]|nr:MAG: hypothetical protein A2050_16680 [Candidatus Rokubacteria bacterium GWA2_73_35]OGK94129.1 MAG: hypothetical protein A2W08_00800 [Candidatus Rokubacteria bacterium RBG_16_73_20]HBH01743.1 hypothetical protein [Candidatus Rokubacteria bacterium]